MGFSLGFNGKEDPGTRKPPRLSPFTQITVWRLCALKLLSALRQNDDGRTEPEVRPDRVPFQGNWKAGT